MHTDVRLCKGFKKLVVHWASIIRNSIALKQNPPVKFPLPKLIFIFKHVGYSSVILCYHKLLLLFIMKTVLTYPCEMAFGIPRNS